MSSRSRTNKGNANVRIVKPSVPRSMVSMTEDDLHWLPFVGGR